MPATRRSGRSCGRALSTGFSAYAVRRGAPVGPGERRRRKRVGPSGSGDSRGEWKVGVAIGTPRLQSRDEWKVLGSLAPQSSIRSDEWKLVALEAAAANTFRLNPIPRSLDLALLTALVLLCGAVPS